MSLDPIFPYAYKKRVYFSLNDKINTICTPLKRYEKSLQLERKMKIKIWFFPFVLWISFLESLNPTDVEYTIVFSVAFLLFEIQSCASFWPKNPVFHCFFQHFQTFICKQNNCISQIRKVQRFYIGNMKVAAPIDKIFFFSSIFKRLHLENTWQKYLYITNRQSNIISSDQSSSISERF